VKEGEKLYFRGGSTYDYRLEAVGESARGGVLKQECGLARGRPPRGPQPPAGRLQLQLTVPKAPPWKVGNVV